MKHNTNEKGGSELSKGHKPFGFEETLHKHMEEWRRRQDFIDGLFKESECLATKNPLLGIERLFVRVTRMRDSVERYLFSHYGFEATWPGAQAIRDYLERSERSPSTPKEWADFWAGWIHWVALEVAVARMCEIAEEAPCLDKSTFRAMRKECEQCLLHLFGCLIITCLLRTSYEKKRLDELVVSENEILGFLAGWVGTQISLQRNPRLKYSLEKEGSSAFSRLLQELPATTLIETDNLVLNGEGPTKLVNRVAKALANVGSGTPELQRDKRLANSDLANVNVVEPMQEAFVAKEELEALRTSTNLSAREDQVLDLMLEDHLEREIAQELGVSEGAVKTTKFRVRQKFKEVAGQ